MEEWGFGGVGKGLEGFGWSEIWRGTLPPSPFPSTSPSSCGCCSFVAHCYRACPHASAAPVYTPSCPGPPLPCPAFVVHTYRFRPLYVLTPSVAQQHVCCGCAVALRVCRNALLCCRSLPPAPTRALPQRDRALPSFRSFVTFLLRIYPLAFCSSAPFVELTTPHRWADSLCSSHSFVIYYYRNVFHTLTYSL